jgi:hypothetical protein
MRTRACFAHAMPILFGRAPTRGATSALIRTRIANAKINAERFHHWRAAAKQSVEVFPPITILKL